MQKTDKMSLKGKTFRKWANGQNVYEFEKKMTQGLFRPCSGAFCKFTVKQVHWSNKFICIYRRSRVSVYSTVGSLVSDP